MCFPLIENRTYYSIFAVTSRKLKVRWIANPRSTEVPKNTVATDLPKHKS